MTVGRVEALREFADEEPRNENQGSIFSRAWNCSVTWMRNHPMISIAGGVLTGAVVYYYTCYDPTAAERRFRENMKLQYEFGHNLGYYCNKSIIGYKNLTSRDIQGVTGHSDLPASVELICMVKLLPYAIRAFGDKLRCSGEIMEVPLTKISEKFHSILSQHCDYWNRSGNAVFRLKFLDFCPKRNIEP